VFGSEKNLSTVPASFFFKNTSCEQSQGITTPTGARAVQKKKTLQEISILLKSNKLENVVVQSLLK
jgi:hypothetical protein